jgi:hypothetical protein
MTEVADDLLIATAEARVPAEIAAAAAVVLVLAGAAPIDHVVIVTAVGGREDLVQTRDRDQLRILETVKIAMTIVDLTTESSVLTIVAQERIDQTLSKEPMGDLGDRSHSSKRDGHAREVRSLLNPRRSILKIEDHDLILNENQFLFPKVIRGL